MTPQEMEQKIKDLEQRIEELEQEVEQRNDQQIQLPLDQASVSVIGKALQDAGYAL